MDEEKHYFQSALVNMGRLEHGEAKASAEIIRGGEAKSIVNTYTLLTQL